MHRRSPFPFISSTRVEAGSQSGFKTGKEAGALQYTIERYERLLLDKSNLAIQIVIEADLFSARPT